MKLENPSAIVDAEMQKQKKRREKRLEKISNSSAENLSAEDLELRKKEIYQEGDAYVENNVGEGQFEYRVTPESRTSVSEKKLTDDEYGELQASFIDKLPSSEAGTSSKKKIDIEEVGVVGKIADNPKQADEIETWETLKRKKEAAVLGGAVQEREKKTMGRVFGEKKTPEVAGTNEKHKDRAAAGGRVFGENKDAFVMGHAEETEKTEAMTEQEKQLELLQSLVAEKRKAYATADYNSETLFSKIKGVLGLKNEQMPTNAKDNFAFQQYQGALNELRNLQIQMMRDKYANIDALPPEEKAARITEMKKEMGDMATYFGVCEKLDLAGARTDARTEAWSETKMGRLGKGALDWSAKRINDYRTMDRKKKIAISIVLLSLGGVGAFSGSVGVISAVAVSKGIQRWLGGAALGAGIATSLESRSRTKVNQKAEKNRGAILENSEASWQEQLQALNEYCGNEMRGFHESLQDEKYGATRRKLLGAGVSVFVGSGAAATLLREGFSWVGHTETFGKVKDVATDLWKSSGVGGIVGAGIESIKAHNPFGSSGGTSASEHGLRDTPASKLGSSANGMEEKFGMDEKFGPKGAPSSSVENGLKNHPSSKLASKIGGMYDEMADKVKGAANKFEKDYLQGTSTPDKAPLHPTEAPAHAGASDGDRFHNAEAGEPTPSHEFFDSGDVKIPKGSSIEREIIKRMQELKIPKPEAGKYAHRMVLRFIEESHGQTTLEKLNLVKPGEVIRFSIDPNNLDNSNIANFRGIAGPQVDISHAGGVALNDARMDSITAQMENEAREREFNNHIVGSEGRAAAVDAKISAAATQEEISRGYNSEIMGEHTMNRATENVSPGNLESIESNLRDGARGAGNSAADFADIESQYENVNSPQLGKDNSVADFSSMESHPNNIPDHRDVSPASLDSIESDLASDDVAKFSKLESQISDRLDAQGIEMPLTEKLNIEKIASIFDSHVGGGNDLANQIVEARNLTGEDFNEAYRKIFGNIANNILGGNVAESFEAFSNMNAEDYLDAGYDHNSKITELIDYVGGRFGSGITEATNGESMKKWVFRMIDKMLESGGVSLLDAKHS
ncbi:MAG: hypothetical protein WC848_04205 [Parcubacteria group bacterium]|jgi:hypothetical protein